MHVGSDISGALTKRAIAFAGLKASSTAPLRGRRFIMKGEKLFRTGDDGDCFYKVVSGMLMTWQMHGTRRIVQSFLLPGEMFGFEREPTRSSSAEALEDCVVISFDRSEIDGFLEDDRSLRAELLQAIATGLQHAYDHMAMLGRKTAEARIAAFLLQMRMRQGAGEDRRSTSSPRISLSMSGSDIADHLGVRRETVSRIMSKMVRDRVIEYSSSLRDIRIVDVRALQQLDGDDIHL